MLRDAGLIAAVHRQAVRVSIDGPAGSGKSTVGRGLAAALGCPYLDTGLMYRAVTWLALQQGVALDNGPALALLARSTTFELGGPGESLIVNGHPPGDELRSREVDASVSAVSAQAEVRRELVVRQRGMARGRCIVMVGRDIGTVVLPDADVKLWIVASPLERARRRLSEHLPGTVGLSLAEAERQIMQRDAQDSSRKVSPLKRPASAVEIDTDLLTPEQCVERALDVIRRVTAREAKGEERDRG
jgi:cytidylate kinase